MDHCQPRSFSLSRERSSASALPRTFIPIAGLVLLTLAAPRWAFGQVSAAATDTTADSTGSAGTLNTVVFTESGDVLTTEGSGAYTPLATTAATKLPLSLRETPQSVSVITRQRIDDQQLNDITKVVEQAPGISVQHQDSERVQFYSRGFKVTDILYDGVPTYPGQYANNGKMQSDTAIYDRVEIVRGAAGLLNGTGNPGASINLIRKKPTSTFQASGEVSVGSWDRYRSEIDVSGPLNTAGTVRGRVVGAVSDGNSFLDYYSKRRTVGYGILEIDLTPRTLLTIGVDSQSSKAKGATWGGLPPFFSDGARTNFPRSLTTATKASWWNEDVQNVFASIDHKLGNGWELKANLNQYRSGYAAELSSWGGWAVRGMYPDRTTGLGAIQFPGKFRENDKTDAVDVYASGPFRLGGRPHQLVLGFSAMKQTHDGQVWSPTSYPALSGSIFSWNHADPLPSFGKPENYTGKNVDVGLYGAVRLRPTDALSVILGTRVADYSRQQDNSNPTPAQYVIYDYDKKAVVTPYAGLVYDLSETYSAYASYSTAFNPQSYADVNGNVLSPLKGKAYEAGIKGEFFQGALNASAALFRIDQDNVAQAAGVTGTTTYYRTASGARTKGVEFEVSGQPLQGWNLGAGLTRQLAKDQEGTRIDPDRPQAQFKLFTTYRLAGSWSRVTVGGGVEWNGKTYSDIAKPVALRTAGTANTIRLDQPSYALASLMVRYAINKALSLNLVVNNLLDRTYYAGTSFYSNVIYGDPRNVMLTLRWNL